MFVGKPMWMKRCARLDAYIERGQATSHYMSTKGLVQVLRPQHTDDVWQERTLVEESRNAERAATFKTKSWLHLLGD